MGSPITNVVGFDDAPFHPEDRGDVRLVGIVCSRTRMDGVLSGRVRRDGRNSTMRMIELVRTSQFRAHVRAVLLQGIAVAGFNVVDVRALHAGLGVPVITVARRTPRMARIKDALFGHAKGAERKWALICAAGPMEAVDVGPEPGSVYGPSLLPKGGRHEHASEPQASGVSMATDRREGGMNMQARQSGPRVLIGACCLPYSCDVAALCGSAWFGTPVAYSSGMNLEVSPEGANVGLWRPRAEGEVAP